MKFEERHEFDVPADTVMKMYSDKAFFDRKYQALEAIECELLDHDESDSRFSVKYRLVMKSDAPLPDAAKKLLGGNIRMVQQDAWDLKKRTGRIDIEIKGAPIRIGADMTLIEEGGKAVNVQKWEIVCKIPLVGGKIESAVSEDVKMKSRKDLAVSRKIVADY